MIASQGVCVDLAAGSFAINGFSKFTPRRRNAGNAFDERLILIRRISTTKKRSPGWTLRIRKPDHGQGFRLPPLGALQNGRSSIQSDCKV